MKNKEFSNPEFSIINENVIIVYLDLDNFNLVMEERGWSVSPNIVTGTLTTEVENFSKKHLGTVYWGLNRKEGTEEAVILLTSADIDSIFNDLDQIREIIQNQKVTTLSIGIGVGPIGNTPKELKSGKREHTLLSSPAALMAKRALRKAKKHRNQIYIESA